MLSYYCRSGGVAEAGHESANVERGLVVPGRVGVEANAWGLCGVGNRAGPRPARGQDAATRTDVSGTC